MWLSDEKKQNTIVRANVIITDSSMKKEMLRELNDKNMHLLKDLRQHMPFNLEYLEYTSEGPDTVFKYSIYISPVLEAKRFLNNYDNFRDDEIDLLNLFKTIYAGDSKEKYIRELKRVSEFMKKTGVSSLDKETLKEIFKLMWPGFGFVATEIMSCTEIEVVKQYNLEEYKASKKALEKIGVEVPREVTSVLSMEKLANSNTKVLTLARQVNNLINNK